MYEQHEHLMSIEQQFEFDVTNLIASSAPIFVLSVQFKFVELCERCEMDSLEIRSAESSPVYIVTDTQDSSRQEGSGNPVSVYSLGQRSERITPDVTLTHIDGLGAYRDQPLSPLEPTSLRAEDLANFPAGIGMQLKGAVALHLTRQEADVSSYWILPDPLGSAMVFFYQHPTAGYFAASTDLAALVRIVQRDGQNISGAPGYFSEMLAQESGGITPSPYNEIRTVPQFHALSITNEGGRLVRYTSLEVLFGGDHNYSSLLEQAATDLIESARAFGKLSGPLTAHLTGGADSRLVLASLLAAGVEDKFQFYCSENSTNKEIVFAENVAAANDLIMTKHSGATSVIMTSDPFARSFTNLSISQGMIMTGVLAGRVSTPGAILGGYHGGTFRSVYPPIGNSSERVSGWEFLASRWRNLEMPGAHLLQESILEELGSSIDRLFQGAREAGAREDALLDYLYLASRNRYFMWLTPFLASRYTPQGGTLYSLAGNRLSLNLPACDRSANRIQFDLFKRLAPNLLDVPFDKPKFRDISGFQELAYTASRRTPRYSNRRASVLPGQVISSPVSAPSRDDIDRARSIGNIPAFYVSSEKASRAHIGEHLRAPSPTVAGALDLTAVRRLIQKSSSTRAKFRVIYRLRNLLSWYSSIE